MALDSNGLSLLWDRIRTYVAAYVSEFGGNADTATVERLGVVKPDGTTITIDTDGTIHGTEQTVIATTNTAGKVKPDGTTITIDEDGTIHGTETYETMGRETIVELTPFGDIIPTGDGREY